MTQSQVEPAAKQFLRTAWSTKGSRFTAHRRMQAMYRWSLGSIAIASIYVVALSLTPIFVELSEPQARWLGLVTILSAVGILVLSLVEAGQRYEVRGERLHECGLQLGALCRKLDVFIAGGCPGGASALGELTGEYDRILREHKENHHVTDYRKFLAENRSEFGLGWWPARWDASTWYVRVYWKFSALVLVPPLGVLMILS